MPYRTLWSARTRSGWSIKAVNLEKSVELSGASDDEANESVPQLEIGDVAGAQEPPVVYTSRRFLGELRPGALGEIKKDRPSVHVKVTSLYPESSGIGTDGKEEASSLQAATDTHQISMSLNAKRFSVGAEDLTFIVSQSKVGSDALDVIAGKPRKVLASYEVKFDQNKKQQHIPIPSKLSATGRGPDAPKVTVSPLGFMDRIVIESQTKSTIMSY